MLSIETHGLTKRFGLFTAVDHLSFSVGEGEVFGLLGPNGAGKTTTVRMLACLLAPTEGSATIDGMNIEKDSLRVRQMFGILTETPSLYERLTAQENMEFFAEAYGLADQRKRAARIKELLDFFGLWDRRSDRVARFSKGLKQKSVDAVKESDLAREVVADDSAGTMTITVDDYESSAPEIVRRIVAADGRIHSVDRVRPSLEEAYLKLVKG